jgi:hypothetical protein
MVFAHVTWSSLNNLVQEKVCKKLNKNLFSGWKYVYDKTVCRLTSSVLVSRNCCLHMWASGNIDTSRQKKSPQHLFLEHYSGVINHAVLHRNDQSTWLQKKEKEFLETTCCIRAAGYKKNWRHQHCRLHSRIEVLAEVPIVWFDSPWRHWDFSLIFPSGSNKALE